MRPGHYSTLSSIWQPGSVHATGKRCPVILFDLHGTFHAIQQRDNDRPFQ